jgi:hypothetical protein
MPARISSADTTLMIWHIADSEPASFQVTRLSDGKTMEPRTPPSPHGFPVEGRPNSKLIPELQWYLESFLDYPFPPETDHAERVLKALRDWVEEGFQDYSNLHLQISSDDPQVLAWPWEALRDPELGVLAHTCQIERRLNTVRDPQPLSDSLPKDSVNILLVVARPYGEQDIGFRSVARPLVELIEKEKVPAYVELLRPPTFDELRERLRKRRGFFHILHFDGHGAYSADMPDSAGHSFQEPEGKLIFETDEGGPDPIPAGETQCIVERVRRARCSAQCLPISHVGGRQRRSVCLGSCGALALRNAGRCGNGVFALCEWRAAVPACLLSPPIRGREHSRRRACRSSTYVAARQAYMRTGRVPVTGLVAPRALPTGSAEFFLRSFGSQGFCAAGFETT